MELKTYEEPGHYKPLEQIIPVPTTIYNPINIERYLEICRLEEDRSLPEKAIDTVRDVFLGLLIGIYVNK